MLCGDSELGDLICVFLLDDLWADDFVCIGRLGVFLGGGCGLVVELSMRVDLRPGGLVAAADGRLWNSGARGCAAAEI